MTRFEATSSGERRGLITEAITAHRKRASDAATFEAAGDDDRPVRVEYADRSLELECAGEERERLDDLLAEFPVFKIAQPETRKAPEGVVYVSAIADPKHAADFVEAVFREVYDRPGSYRLWVVEV